MAAPCSCRGSARSDYRAARGLTDDDAIELPLLNWIYVAPTDEQARAEAEGYMRNYWLLAGANLHAYNCSGRADS